jgi:hypothetical protein
MGYEELDRNLQCSHFQILQFRAQLAESLPELTVGQADFQCGGGILIFTESPGEATALRFSHAERSICVRSRLVRIRLGLLHHGPTAAA